MKTLWRDLGFVISVLSLSLGGCVLWNGLDDRDASVYVVAGATFCAIGLIAAVLAVRRHWMMKDLERYARGAYQRGAVEFAEEHFRRRHGADTARSAPAGPRIVKTNQ